MSDRVNQTTTLAMDVSSAFHSLSSAAIHNAKLLDEKDATIKELRKLLSVATAENERLQKVIEGDSGCEENARLQKELKDLNDDLEPLTDEMSGWTGACNFTDVVDYVDQQQEKIDDAEDRFGTIHGFLTTWGEEGDNKEYPPTKEQLTKLAENYSYSPR